VIEGGRGCEFVSRSPVSSDAGARLQRGKEGGWVGGRRIAASGVNECRFAIANPEDAQIVYVARAVFLCCGISHCHVSM